MSEVVLHVCTGRLGITRRVIQYCRWCDVPGSSGMTRKIEEFCGYWGGWTTCTGCGTIVDWGEGERRRPKPGLDRSGLIAAWKAAMAPDEYRRAIKDFLTL